MTQDIAPNRQFQPGPPPSRWKENHGNLLLVFVVIVFLMGAGILFYRQNRFVPVRFPDADMIDVPMKPQEELADAVTIRVTGAANDFGMIRIAIYDSDEHFNQPADALATQSVSVAGGEAVWKISVNALPEKFAIAAYHDENSDEALNRNRFGIPTERYGFSRNARGLTGPPAFKQAVIGRPAIGETIELFIR